LKISGGTGAVLAASIGAILCGLANRSPR
jgi:hypothetical protein